MKISKLFHWLYACVMFLPLLVIPIFAIYTINHEPTPLVVETDKRQVLDYNQLIDFHTSNNQSFLDNDVIDDYTCDLSGEYTFTRLTDIRITNGNLFYIEYSVSDVYSLSECFVYLQGFNGNIGLTNRGSTTGYLNVLSATTYLRVVCSTYNGYVIDNLSIKVNVVDLTKMFGSGNEPTAQVFHDTYFSYRDFTLSKKINVVVGQNVYDDTDIGSQYLYSLYHTTDKYFNYDDVFNLGVIAQWLDTNVFNGSTPLGFSIMWHYLDYWLLVSIFWLCFDVLIYVPQLAHRWLDKASLE